MAGVHETAGRQSYIFSAAPIVSEKTMLSKFRLVFIGALLNNLHELNQAGALAWDGSHLWVAIGASSQNGATCATGVSVCALLYQLDVSTGNVIKTLDISSIFAADQECNFIDGLDYD